MRKINNVFLLFITAFILITSMISMGGCATMQAKEIKDEIDNLSFSHDGKKVIFDRCRDKGCQIQIYDLETGELAAYQSPKAERWTMGKYSYDGKRITFSVIPIEPNDDLDLGGMQIAVMDTDGKNYKKITSGPGAKLYPTFSHNGKKILYACAAYIREKGKTPAAQYDAWEVNLETGEQARLTFFKYFYMSNLTYFPDDERFIYYGDRPEEFKGLDWHKNIELFKKLMNESEAEGKKIYDVVVMKGKDLIKNPYVFLEKTFPQKPLLSKDGSVLIYEKSHSGKFYLYSPDGNHRLVGGGGSITSSSVSSNGELLGVCYSVSMTIFKVADGSRYKIIFLPSGTKYIKNWDDEIRKNQQQLKVMQELPSLIINR